MVLTLVTTARCLRNYFQSHTIVVVANQLFKRILGKPDVTGRLLKWAVELSESDVQYQPWSTIKAQTLVDFVVESTPPQKSQEEVLGALAPTY